MILLRKNAFSETAIEIPFKDSETVQSLVVRTITSNGYEDSEMMLSHFQVLINGLKVDKELWRIIVVKEEDQVLIAPIISRGEGGQLFKTFAIIAITLTVAYFYPPALGMGNVLLVAGANIASTLLMNSLIPPPALPGLGGLGSLDSADSQMYSITSQSNSVKKFGAVPKVYGTHRIFPLVAANPYTDIQPDPETKSLVQYFYGVYDFGFGPSIVSDIRIGNTPIEEFSNKEYVLVDFNKPATDEGVWDEVLEENLYHYKGDLEKEAVTYALDKNSTDSGAAEDDFRVIRNASSVVGDSIHEIILNFVCPQGLISYATNGKTYNRNIDLLIQFRRADEPDNWRAFNDLNYVYHFDQGVGAEEEVFRDVYIPLIPINNRSYYTSLGSRSGVEYPKNGGSRRRYTDYSYGFKKGRTYFEAATGSVLVGQAVFFNGVHLGNVVSITTSTLTGYSRYNLNRAINKTYVLFTYRSYNDGGFSYTPTVANSSKLLYIKPLSLGEVIVSDKTTTQKYFTIKFKPKEVTDYVIRVTRVRSYSSATYQVQDKLTLIDISTRFDREPIVTDKRHTFLDLKIRATNQLNGSISNLSGVVTSVLDVYDPNTQTWSKQPTSNPAWVF